MSSCWLGVPFSVSVPWVWCEHRLSQSHIFRANQTSQGIHGTWALWTVCPRLKGGRDCVWGADDAELSTLLSNVCWPKSKASCIWTALYTNRQHRLLSPKLEAFYNVFSCGHWTPDGRPPTGKHNRTSQGGPLITHRSGHLFWAVLSDVKEPANNPL